MIQIDNKNTRTQVLDFLVFMKERQIELQKNHPKKILYTCINLHYAVKNKIAFLSFLTHKLAMKEKLFYEDSISYSTDKEMLVFLNKVLEYELSSDLSKILINSKDIRALIKFKNKIESKIFKKENRLQSLSNGIE